MKAPGLYFSEWLRRLGVQAFGNPLEVVPSVQPVTILADHRYLFPELFPPTAYFGGFFSTTAANRRFALRVLCKAPGGAWIRDLVISNGTAARNAQYSYYIQAGNFGLIGAGTDTPINVGLDPVVSLVQHSETINAIFPDLQDPTVFCLPFEERLIGDIFIPAGGQFGLGSSGAAGIAQVDAFRFTLVENQHPAFAP